MALADLMATAFPSKVEAVTVDHGLRPESAAEAAMVEAWCAARSIPHAILTLPKPIAGTIQAGARKARYAVLEAWRLEKGVDWIVTAHHADDQLETMLMRLNRGSGVGGLAGVRARRGAVLRPLLGVRKADLVAHVEANAIPYVRDPSNGDMRFDRVRLRAALAGVDWLDARAAVRCASALADADAALLWASERLYGGHVQAEGDSLVLTETDLPRELLFRLLSRMIASMAPDAPPPRGEAIEKALVQLFDGRKLSLGDCVVTGGERWTVRKAPPRKPQ